MINKQLGEEFTSLASVKKRGTVIYVDKNLQPKLIFGDSDGRFVAVECILKGRSSTFAPVEQIAALIRETAGEEGLRASLV